MKEKRELRARLRREDTLEGVYLPVGIDSLQSVYRPVGIKDSNSLYLPPGIEHYKTLFTFLSLPSEPDTAPLNRLALAHALTVAAPRIQGDAITFHRIASADGPFASGPHGIREPLPTDPRLWPTANPGDTDPLLQPNEPIYPGTEIQFPLLVAVPSLAFTLDGRRLGRGGGYYDRFLSALLAEFADRRGEITLMGLCPERRVLLDIPTEPHDIRVDCLMTEKAYIICKDHA